MYAHRGVTYTPGIPICPNAMLLQCTWLTAQSFFIRAMPPGNNPWFNPRGLSRLAYPLTEQHNSSGIYNHIFSIAIYISSFLRNNISHSVP